MATPKEVLSRLVLNTKKPNTIDYIEKAVEEENDHHLISYLAKKLRSPLSDRESFLSIIWKELDEKTIVFAVIDCTLRTRKRAKWESKGEDVAI